jgi:hypothetical protein
MKKYLLLFFSIVVSSMALAQWNPGMGPYTKMEENGLVKNIPAIPNTFEAAKAMTTKYRGISMNSGMMFNNAFRNLYTGDKEFPKNMDCKRYYDAYNDPKAYNASNGRKDILAIRNMYQNKKISWLGDIENLNKGKAAPLNKHKIIDGPWYGEQVYIDVINKDVNLDATFKFILKNYQFRNSPSAQDDFLRQLSWACNNYIIYMVNLDIMRRAEAKQNALDPQIIKRKEDISCTTFYTKAMAQIKIWPNELVPSDHQFHKTYKDKIPDKIKNLDVVFFSSYIGYMLSSLKERTDYYKHFEVLMHARKMADVLFCSNRIKSDDPIIKDIDEYLNRSLNEAPVNTCQLEEIAKVDTEFINKKKRVALLYDNLPSTAKIRFVNWYESQKQIEALDAKNILGKIGKDFIDQAVKNLVVVSYLYGIKLDQYEDLDFKCESFFSGSTSDYCKNFQSYSRLRLIKEKDTTVKTLTAQGKKPILNCGGSGVLNGVLKNFTQAEIEKHMPQKLPKNQTPGFKSIPDSYNEPFKMAVYKRISEVAADKNYRSIVPLLYSPAFIDQFRLAKQDVYSMAMPAGHGGSSIYYKTIGIETKAVSCNTIIESLKKSLIENVIFISNPDSFFKIGGWEVGKDFNKSIAKGTENVKNYTKGYWREIKENPVEAIMSLVSPAIVNPTQIKVMSNAMVETDKTFNPLPSLNEHPEGYVKHLMFLLKHQKQDQFGHDIKDKYLNEFKGYGKLVCTLYHKIDYDKYYLDEVIKQNMKFFYGVAKTVAILVTVASWVIPPAGALVTTALAAGISTTTTLANIDDLSGKLNGVTQDYNLAMQSCMEDQLQIHRTVAKEDARKNCEASLNYLLQVNKLSKELSGKYGTLIFETALYSFYMIRVGVGMAQAANHTAHAAHHTANATSGFAKVKEVYKAIPHKMGDILTNYVGKPLQSLAKGATGSTKVGQSIANFFAKNADKLHHTKIGHNFVHGLEHMAHDGVYGALKIGKSAYYVSMFSKVTYLAYFGGDAYKAALVALRMEKAATDYKSNNPNVAIVPDAYIEKERVKIEAAVAKMSKEDVLAELKLDVEII